jgi:hypothetical protein
MSAHALEALLARLYTDAHVRAQFLAAPLAYARAAGLDEADACALVAIDRAGLEMAAASFGHKRAGRSGGGRWRRTVRWLRRMFGLA